MARVVETHFRVADVALECLSAGRQKEGIVFAPRGEQRRLLRAEIFLELRIEGDVAGVVEKQIKLNFANAVGQLLPDVGVGRRLLAAISGRDGYLTFALQGV